MTQESGALAVERYRRYRRNRFDRKHPAHDIRRGRDGRRLCRTCVRERRWSEVDQVVVERAAAGDPPARMTPPERAAAILLLHGRGLSGSVIAERVGCHARTVSRVLSANRANPQLSADREEAGNG